MTSGMWCLAVWWKWTRERFITVGLVRRRANGPTCLPSPSLLRSVLFIPYNVIRFTSTYKHRLNLCLNFEKFDQVFKLDTGVWKCCKFEGDIFKCYRKEERLWNEFWGIWLAAITHFKVLPMHLREEVPEKNPRKSSEIRHRRLEVLQIWRGHF
jgi:hypothetical protein